MVKILSLSMIPLIEAYLLIYSTQHSFFYCEGVTGNALMTSMMSCPLVPSALLIVCVHICLRLSVSFVPGYDARSKTEFLCSTG